MTAIVDALPSDVDVVWFGEHPVGARGVHAYPIDPIIYGPSRSLLREALTIRGRALADYLRRSPVDLLVTEYFPWSRTTFLPEVIQCLRAVQGMIPVVGSARDIIGESVSRLPRSEREALLVRYYTHIVWHGDRALLPFDGPTASLPLFESGYVVQPITERASATVRRRIVASVGRGTNGLIFLKSVLNALRRLDRSYHALILAGAQYDNVKEIAGDLSDRVEMRAWVNGLDSELTSDTISVTQCGYNTFAETVKARVPAVFMPFETRFLNEQAMRAATLHGSAGYAVVAQTARDVDRELSRQIESLADARPSPPRFSANGAAVTARMLCDIARS
jgi:predicted glycosyltransferase